MASARPGTVPIGSLQWLQNEREQVRPFVDQEVEEFSFSVRNELEWLNEHMAEIFNREQINFADTFKTPGKLRGKTPHTTRKQNVLGVTRQPLTDIFAPNSALPSAAHQSLFNDRVAPFKIAEDNEDQAVRQSPRPANRAGSPKRAGMKGYTDSGYHGMMTEDEMEMERMAAKTDMSSSQVHAHKQSSPPKTRNIKNSAMDGISDQDSFVSAKEEVQTKSSSLLQGVDTAHLDSTKEAVDVIDHAQQQAEDEEDLSSIGTSSPEKPKRKSSFTFTSLPGRDQYDGTGRSSAFGKSYYGGKSLGATAEEDRSEETRQQEKSSAMSLHERIKMLGKTKEPRTSKSIPQPMYPRLPSMDAATPAPVAANTDNNAEDSEDDWIAPTKPAQKAVTAATEQSELRASPRLAGHLKSVSTTNLPSPTRTAMTQEERSRKVQSVVVLPANTKTTTPAGSPMGKYAENGALSASRSKLYSVLKSAKSIFASSANASAAAKVEAHNTSPSRIPMQHKAETTTPVRSTPRLQQQQDTTRAPSPRKSPSRSPLKATRSPEKLVARDELPAHHLEDDEDVLDDTKNGFAASTKEDRLADTSSVRQKGIDASRLQPANSSTMHRTHTAGSLRAPDRVAKPTAQPAKPAPVSIRVASQLQRLGAATSSSLKKQQETAAPPPAPKTSLRTTSAQSVRSSTAPSNARVKALEAAARKKEADEKAAQKKLEQKRELERKRALKAEEEKRVEEERRAQEQQRLQEARLAAQKEAEKRAAEVKRRGQLRLEQVRQQEEAQKAKAAQELADAMKRERLQQAAAPQHPRGDVGGTLRQVAKHTVPEPKSTSQVNTIKTIKRPRPEEEEQASQHTSQVPPPQRPGMARAPPSYQQNDAKRRRTEEEDSLMTGDRHSVMAPPKRPSNMRKESVLNKYTHGGYTHAPPPAAHQSSSIFKAIVTTQHQLQHSTNKPMPGAHPSQMVQVSNGHIPFAASAASSATNTAYSTHANHPQYKTPLRPVGAPGSSNYPNTAAKSAKSSPLYHAGDNIALPDIQTDSEEESDSDAEGPAGFRAPSWVASPALRDLLTQQQLVDPESVFGPIAELKMEEVFKGTKTERLKRFRERGSSARWVESGDAVTEAEKRRDMELRERGQRWGLEVRS